MLMLLATSVDRTNKVTGMPFRPITVDNARPKFPPPRTAMRTGKGGGGERLPEGVAEEEDRFISRFEFVFIFVWNLYLWNL